MKGSILVEYDRTYQGERVVASSIRKATEDEILEAQAKYLTKGECDHSIVQDDNCWLYNQRECITCGEFLGFI